MKILYIGRFNMQGDAASIRVYNIGCALKKSGHEIDYVCQEGNLKNGTAVFEDSTYYTVYNEKTGKVQQYLDWLFGNRVIKTVKKCLQCKRYDVAVLYNTSAVIYQKVSKLCKKEQISLVNDVTEWYEIGHGHGFLISVYALLVGFRIKHLDRISDGVIAISPYLYKYYWDKVRVIQIPPIFSYTPTRNTSGEHDVKNFLYAGSPSRKDELHTFLHAVEMVNADGVKIRMTLVGVPVPENWEELAGKEIYFMPRMTNKEVIQRVSQSDFTVLIRREERYAKAGYSTKIAESLYNGTPVFCNAIGGADLDIEHGVTGIKTDNADEDSLVAALRYVAVLSAEDVRQIKDRCFAFGQQKYSMDSYVALLDSFFRECKK